MSRIELTPIIEPVALKERVYDSLKTAITEMDIYSTDEEIRLDERKLSDDLGVSRTPVRESLARLEQEGFVENIPRRGAFVVRKTRQEIIEMIQVWAALEGMATRLITQTATDDAIGELRKLFTTFEGDAMKGHIDEYSDTNVHFHQRILAMGGNDVLQSITDNLFLHLRSIRARTIHEKDRADRSIIDHIHIIEAIESRDADAAARLSIEHNLGLATHVLENVHWLK